MGKKCEGCFQPEEICESCEDKVLFLDESQFSDIMHDMEEDEEAMEEDDIENQGLADLLNSM